MPPTSSPNQPVQNRSIRALLVSVIGKPFRSAYRVLGRHGLELVFAFSIWTSGSPFQLSSKEPTWPYQQTVGRFIVNSNHSLSQSQELLTQIEDLQADVQTMLELPASTAPLYVVLFDQSKTYEQYLRHYFPGVPVRRAMFIKHRGPGMVFAHLHSELPVDLRHESTHALLDDSIGKIPLWLDEGLAEYFEVAKADRMAAHPHLQSTRWKARAAIVPDLDALEKITKTAEMGSDQYRDAWAWVHFLLHRSPATRKLLVTHIQELRSDSVGRSLAHRVRTEIPQWRDEFLQHFRSFPIQNEPVPVELGQK